MRLRVLTHDVDPEAKNHPARSGVWLPLRSTLNLFIARLAVDHPAYTMVICPVKSLIDVNSDIFDQTVENYSDFIS